MLRAMLCSLIACSSGCALSTEPFVGAADLVVDAPSAETGGFRDPEAAVDGVRGAGEGAGSLNVYSIFYGEHLVLGWAGARVVDGPGSDLVVFENPFRFGDGLTFMDPIVVEVSTDGETWVAFPHDYVAADDGAYSARAEDWVGFAGVTPVLLHAEDNPVDPFDPFLAGGDHFDIASLPESGEGARVRADGFAFVRLGAAADHVDPDTGELFLRDITSNGPDVDGVFARHVVGSP